MVATAQARSPRPLAPGKLERSLKHSLVDCLALLRRAGGVLDPSGAISASLRRVENEAGRAMLPEDWFDVVDQIADLKIPISAGAPADDSLREVAARVLRRMQTLARMLSASDIEVTLRHLKPRVENEPAPQWSDALDAELQGLLAATDQLQEARDVLQQGLASVTAELSLAAGRQPERQERLARLQNRISSASDVEELQHLRAQLLKEASAFTDEVRSTHEELELVRKKATTAQARARRLAKAFSEAEDAARSDVLTEFGNQRDLDGWVRSVSEKDRPCAVLRIEIDGLARARDENGSEVGDAILQRVAACLKGVLRPGDRAFRLRADDLLLVIKGASKADAGVLARRMNQAVSRLRLEQDLGAPSLSVGGSVWTGDQDFLGALSVAEQAFLDAKRQGPGRVILR